MQYRLEGLMMHLLQEKDGQKCKGPGNCRRELEVDTRMSIRIPVSQRGHSGRK